MSEREEKLLEAVQWCSGADDFQENGQARLGWLRLCAPLLDWSPDMIAKEIAKYEARGPHPKPGNKRFFCGDCGKRLDDVGVAENCERACPCGVTWLVGARRKEGTRSKEMTFSNHIDRCRQCLDHPFDLCPVGARLLQEEAGR